MASSWERLGSTTLGSAGDQIDVTIAARKYLIIKVHAEGDGAAKLRMRFNDDSGSNYSYRASPNGGSDGNSSSGGTEMDIDNVNLDDGEQAMNELYVINVADKEKICINNQINNGGVGAGNAPDRVEQTTKWVNTSAQIVKVSLINPMGGDYAVGSTVTVWGTDDQGTTAKDKSTITNVPVGTRYEETDTRKIFRRTGTTTIRALGDVVWSASGSSGETISGNDIYFDNGNQWNHWGRSTDSFTMGAGTATIIWKLHDITTGGTSAHTMVGFGKDPISSASMNYDNIEFYQYTDGTTMNPFYQIDSSNATPSGSMGSESGNWDALSLDTVFKMTMDTDGKVTSYVDITGGGTFEVIKTSTRNATAGTYYIHVTGKQLGGANDVTFSVIKNPAWVEKGTA